MNQGSSCRRPRVIQRPALARERGPNFDKVARLPATPAKESPPRRQGARQTLGRVRAFRIGKVRKS